MAGASFVFAPYSSVFLELVLKFCPKGWVDRLVEGFSRLEFLQDRPSVKRTSDSEFQKSIRAFKLSIHLMDKATHLSVIVDLSPAQWHLSSLSNNEFPLSLEYFLSQLLAFLNTHVASKHENTLAVFGAFPGKRFASTHKT